MSNRATGNTSGSQIAAAASNWYSAPSSAMNSPAVNTAAAAADRRGSTSTI